MNRLVTAVVLAVLILFGTSGCTILGLTAAAGVGAAAIVYTQGDLESDIDASLEDTYEASKRALEDLGYEIEEMELNDDDARVAAEDPVEDKEVTVNLEDKGGGATHVSIRYGTIGDEEKSREIYDKIRDYTL